MKLRAPHLVFGVSVLCLAFVGLRGWLGAPATVADPAPGRFDEAFAAELPKTAPANFVQWKAPTAQSAGREWIFEVFTPPIIYFDPETQQFTVRPPLAPEVPPVFGLMVEGIQRVPYRLQYAGHHGEAGRFFVEIRDLSDGAYYRGRVGEYIEDGAFSLQRFVADVRKVQPPDRPWATPYLETFIELEVMDERLGEAVRFGREPLYLPDPVAVVRLDGRAEASLLKAGDALEGLEGRFVIDAIDESTREVTVSKYDFSSSLLERKSFFLEPAPEPVAR